jgi:hypothetical protein
MTRGTIEKIWHNRRTDGSEYWVIKIDGKTYSTFDPEHISYTQEGDAVEFSYSQNGSYRNLIAIKPLNSPVSPISEEVFRKVRTYCIIAASLLLVNAPQQPEQKADIAIEMAQKLEKYALIPLRDYTPDSLKSMPKNEGEGRK